MPTRWARESGLRSRPLVTVTISFARGTVSGRSTSVSARLNIAALAPTPIAIEAMATNEKPGFFRSIRAPCLRSCQSVPIIIQLSMRLRD